MLVFQRLNIRMPRSRRAAVRSIFDKAKLAAAPEAGVRPEFIGFGVGIRPAESVEVGPILRTKSSSKFWV